MGDCGKVLPLVNIMKIAIAITSFGDVPFDAYINHIMCLCDWTKKHTVFIVPDYGNTLVAAREHGVGEAVKEGADYILYVDSDVIMPLNTLDSLISCNADLASGLCVRRGPPFDDVAWLKISDKMMQPRFDPYEPGYHPVEWVGGGCALFKVSVFDKLEKPYFRHVFEDGKQLYEDIYLCKKMREKGMTVVLDSRVQCGHICRGIAVYPKTAHIFKEMYELLSNTKI